MDVVQFKGLAPQHRKEKRKGEEGKEGKRKRKEEKEGEQEEDWTLRVQPSATEPG